MPDAEGYNNGNTTHTRHNMHKHIFTTILALIGAACITATPLAKRRSRREFKSVEIANDMMDAESDDDDDGVDDLVMRCRGSDGMELDTKVSESVFVHRTKRSRFVKRMSYWVKTEFPGIVRHRTVVDDEVARMAVTKHMRSLNVRNKDIVLLLPRIMTLAYMPTASDIAEAEMWATPEADERMNALRRIAPRRSVWDWILRRKAVGFVLDNK